MVLFRKLQLFDMMSSSVVCIHCLRVLVLFCFVLFCFGWSFMVRRDISFVLLMFEVFMFAGCTVVVVFCFLVVCVRLLILFDAVIEFSAS